MGSKKDRTEYSDAALGQVMVVEGLDDPDILHDEVFGTITDQGPNYRNVGWLGSAALMMKSQIGLGVLSIPGAFDTLGLIPGVLCLLSVAVITTWSNHIVGVFKLNHPEIYGVADVGGMISGRLGREILGAGFALYLTFGAGSGMLGASIGLNSVSTHGTCTAVFVAVTAIAVICLSSIRTLGRLSLLAWGGLVSLLVAASPALGSAGKIVKQISYGIALPGLVVGATLSTHMASKYVFVRILAGSRHLAANTMVHWGTWLGCTFSVGTVAYIVASGIPAFGRLVSLIGALLGTLQCFQPMGCMWLYDNWSKGKMQEHRSRKWIFMVAWSVFVIVIGNFLMVAGTYGSVVGIIQSYGTAASSRPWSCADNSNSA
ncbi:N amino acid transport system protein [Beauveria bassiana]|nr:N amino acid transport system protein [Beauveria bassiana]